jgi:hypothetical protein
MIIIKNKFKKVADFCYELFRIAELPIYFHKFSNKIYTNFQHIFLLVYKQFRKFTYEELMTDLNDNVSLKSYLGLKKLPHYSTLSKFCKRLDKRILERLMIAFKEIIPIPKKVAIDATGISLDNASKHYCKRIGVTYKKRPFLKCSFVVDIDTYIILFSKNRKKTRHDTIDAKPLIKRIAKHYKDIEVFYADRGYDSNEIFKLCIEELNAYPLILQKNIHIPKHRRFGKYRKQTIDEFDYGEYLQRNKIETLNSMIKKRFSSKIRARTYIHQKADMMFRIIAYNIDRLLRIGNETILVIVRIVRVSH